MIGLKLIELKLPLNSSLFKKLYFSGDKKLNHSMGKGIVWNIKKLINKIYNLIASLFVENISLTWAK